MQGRELEGDHVVPVGQDDLRCRSERSFEGRIRPWLDGLVEELEIGQHDGRNVRVVLDRRRVERVEAVGPPKEHLPGVALVGRSPVELIALEAVVWTVVSERAGGRVEPRQPSCSAQPEMALLICQHRPDGGIGQALLLAVASCDLSRRPIESVEAIGRADPEDACAILKDGSDACVAQAVGVLRLRSVIGEALRLAVEPAQATAGADPQNPCPIFVGFQDQVAAEALWVVGVVLIAGDKLPAVAVELKQPIGKGADP